jgi:hypothetical protein
MKTTNQEDKLTAVLNMTEHPEQYTDKQIEALLADDECADYYRLMSDAVSAYADAPAESEEEIETEWQRITDREGKKTLHRSLSVRKIAAVIIAVLALSAVSYAAVRLIAARQHQSAPAPVSEVTQVPDNIDQQQSAPTDIIHVFQNAELQDILTAVADHYQLRTEYRSEEVRHVRLYIKWNKDESVEKLVKRLNRFDKVNMVLEGDVLIVQ